jgi:hypothetical protein
MLAQIVNTDMGVKYVLGVMYDFDAFSVKGM